MNPSFLKHFFFPVFFLLVFQGEGRGEVRVTEKIPIKTDIVSNFGAKIQANVDNILAAFPIDETHQFYQKLVGRADEIHEAILDNIGDIGLRSVDDLNQFFDDIAAAGEELMEAFAAFPNSIKAWDEALIRNLPESLRRNPDFIEPFAKAIDEKPKIDLHLTGHINGSGNAVGCHIASAIDGVNIRLRNPQPSGLPTYYPDGKLKNAAVDIKDISGNWVSKNANSTFFPDSWTYDKVLEEIAYVRSIGSNKITDRIWKGKGSDGITEIQVEYTGVLDNLTFSTVYPVIN